MEGYYIDITGADLRVLVNKAYELSVPRGSGFLHFEPGDLPDAEVDEILSRAEVDEILSRGQVSMDYVQGRAVKLYVLEKDGKRFIPGRWFDHTAAQLQCLLKAIGVRE